MIECAHNDPKFLHKCFDHFHKKFFVEKTYFLPKSHCRTEGEILAKNLTNSNMPKSYLLAGLWTY
jgi:hypothetical protein